MRLYCFVLKGERPTERAADLETAWMHAEYCRHVKEHFNNMTI